MIGIAASFCACLCFSIVFSVPKKYLFFTGLSGAISWATYLITFQISSSSVISVFFGSIAVALFGEILAHKLKTPVPMFVIPGIFPLVPGSGIYYTMLALIENDFTHASTHGTQTLFLAGAIASGLIIVTSAFRVIKGRV